MKIINKIYKWNGTLKHRARTDYIILHHAASVSCSPDDIHRIHVNNGWTGIGYHFFVRKDGSVYTGRPIDMTGAHTSDYNSQAIGVCFEGNYETEMSMPESQIKSGQELVSYLKKIYPNAKVKKHMDFNSTACPGKNFPFNEIVYGETKKQIQQKELITANDIIWELMNGKYKIKISEVDRAVKALGKAKNSEEFSSLYWILYKLVNDNG